MSFNLIINSGTGTQDVAGQVNSITYNIDWQNISKGYRGAYDVTFFFTSVGFANAGTVAIPVLDWGAIPDNFQATPTTTRTGATQSFNLGFVKAGVIGVNVVNTLTAESNQNAPVRINSIPTQNQFRIKLINAFSAGLFAFVAPAYMMNIKFQAVD